MCDRRVRVVRASRVRLRNQVEDVDAQDCEPRDRLDDAVCESRVCLEQSCGGDVQGRQRRCSLVAMSDVL